MPGVFYVQDLLTQQKIIGELKAIDIGYSRPPAYNAPSKMVKPWNWMNSLAHGGGVLNNGLTHQLGMLERMTGMKVVSTVGEAKAEVWEAPVVPEIRDFRTWVRKELTPEEASKFEWRVCDAENNFSAFFKLARSVSDRENSVLVTMRPQPAVPASPSTRGWYFCGSNGTLVGEDRLTLTPLTLYNMNETVEELSVPQQFLDAMPRIGDDIQNRWGALVRDFLADIQNCPHEPYLTFQDGWRYQVAIDAIRTSQGWTQLPC